MVKPVVCTAIAAVIGFYVLSSVHDVITIIVLLLSIIILSLFNVLTSIGEHIEKEFVRSFRIMAVCCTAFAAGLVIGLCANEAGKNIIRFGIEENRITGIEGVLLEDPRVLPGGSIMAAVSLRESFSANSSNLSGMQESVRVSSSGEITLFFPQENLARLREFGRGTRIFAEGNLRSTEHLRYSGWSFSAYSLHITQPAPAIEQMRTNIRLNLLERFDGKQWGGLALALLVGIRDNLDSGLTAAYRDAGIAYVLALSGMHLAIIAAVIAFLLKKPLGLKAASITGAVIISLYCLFVGPMPSLIRSAIMYLLGVIAVLGALPKKSIPILSLAFLIQIIVMPSSGNTISFMLSYLALLGILITSRHVVCIFRGLIPDFVLQPFAMSVGAFLATAAICSFFFGFIAPIGIIVSLVIIPLITIFMIGSMIWLVLDLLSISFILDFPLLWIYRLMEMVISIAGNVPGIRADPFIVLVVSLVLLALITFLDFRRREGILKLKPFS